MYVVFGEDVIQELFLITSYNDARGKCALAHSLLQMNFSCMVHTRSHAQYANESQCGIIVVLDIVASTKAAPFKMIWFHHDTRVFRPFRAQYKSGTRRGVNLCRGAIDYVLVFLQRRAKVGATWHISFFQCQPLKKE